jgi:hypothetical protein
MKTLSKLVVSLLMVCALWLLWVATASAAPAAEYSLVINVMHVLNQLGLPVGR